MTVSTLLTANPRAADARVLWPVEPQFRLNQLDRMYQDFWCDEAGQAILVDGDNQLVVKFDYGWPTDISSTPSIFRVFVPQTGPHAPAAVLHDRLLGLGMDRAVARKWMHTQLLHLDKVTKFRRRSMYVGVWAWDMFILPLRFGKPRGGFKW